MAGGWNLERCAQQQQQQQLLHPISKLALFSSQLQFTQATIHQPTFEMDKIKINILSQYDKLLKDGNYRGDAAVTLGYTTQTLRNWIKETGFQITASTKRKRKSTFLYIIKDHLVQFNIDEQRRLGRNLRKAEIRREAARISPEFRNKTLAAQSKIVERLLLEYPDAFQQIGTTRKRSQSSNIVPCIGMNCNDRCVGRDRCISSSTTSTNNVMMTTTMMTTHEDDEDHPSSSLVNNFATTATSSGTATVSSSSSSRSSSSSEGGTTSRSSSSRKQPRTTTTSTNTNNTTTYGSSKRRISVGGGEDEWRTRCLHASSFYCSTLPGLEEATYMFGYLKPPTHVFPNY